jgi:putative hemolysin
MDHSLLSGHTAVRKASCACHHFECRHNILLLLLSKTSAMQNILLSVHKSYDPSYDTI